MIWLVDLLWIANFLEEESYIENVKFQMRQGGGRTCVFVTISGEVSRSYSVLMM